jgi:Transposase DDE domain group 1
MQNTVRRPKITVSADGKGLVSQAGGLLLAEAARVTGLGQGLSGALERWRASRAVHDPGKIVSDLVMTLALGGDCLADVAVLRAWPELAGPVASDPVISRLVAALAAEGPRALRAIRKARAARRYESEDDAVAYVNSEPIDDSSILVRMRPQKWLSADYSKEEVERS